MQIHPASLTPPTQNAPRNCEGRFSVEPYLPGTVKGRPYWSITLTVPSSGSNWHQTTRSSYCSYSHPTATLSTVSTSLLAPASPGRMLATSFPTSPPQAHASSLWRPRFRPAPPLTPSSLRSSFGAWHWRFETTCVGRGGPFIGHLSRDVVQQAVLAVIPAPSLSDGLQGQSRCAPGLVRGLAEVPSMEFLIGLLDVAAAHSRVFFGGLWL